MTRPYKEYKTGDVIELTKEEQIKFCLCLLLQSRAVQFYVDLKESPIPVPATDIEKAKQYGQDGIKNTWRYLQSIFPGLGDGESFLQDEKDVGKYERFIVCDRDEAIKVLAEEPDGTRLHTPEWESLIKEYREKHGIHI